MDREERCQECDKSPRFEHNFLSFSGTLVDLMNQRCDTLSCSQIKKVFFNELSLLRGLM